jgi:hypothetical protein
LPVQAPSFRKIVVSVAVGVIVLLAVGIPTRFGQPLSLAVLAILVAGMTVVVQLAVEFGENSRQLREMTAAYAQQSEHLTRLAAAQVEQTKQLESVMTMHQKRAEQLEDTVTAGFAKINQATELFSLLEASALRSDVVIQLVRDSTQLDPDSPILISRFAQAEIGRVSEFLKDLADGRSLTYDGEDRDWILALTHSAETSIDATSLSTVDAGGKGSVDAGLWTSDLGQRYLDVQRLAIQRGVRIRRVFIMGLPDLAADGIFLDVCQRQRDMGIQVRILDSSQIPGARRTSLFDFVLFDDVISYEVTPALPAQGTTRTTILNTRLELRRFRVRDRMQRFRDLWALAHELD